MAPKRPRLKVLRNGKAVKKQKESARKSPPRRRIIITVPEKPPPPDEDRPPKIARPEFNGGALYAGGVKGNRGGRPPNEFKETLAAMASHDAVLDSLWVILLNPNHEHHMAARNYASKLGYPDLAAASKRPSDGVSQTDDVLIAKLRTVYERLTRAIHHEEASPELRRLQAAEEVASVPPPEPDDDDAREQD